MLLDGAFARLLIPAHAALRAQPFAIALAEHEGVYPQHQLFAHRFPEVQLTSPGGDGANVRLVSLCDKLHNARSIVADLRTHGPEVWDRFKGGRDGSLWYYRALVDAYRRAGMSSPHLDELARTVDEMTRLAR